jgi:hypothetical protein
MRWKSPAWMLFLTGRPDGYGLLPDDVEKVKHLVPARMLARNGLTSVRNIVETRPVQRTNSQLWAGGFLGVNRCEIDLSDGRHISFSFHQFTAVELLNYFASGFDIEDLRGLDLFHSRFMPDPRWNPICRPGDSQLADELARLENAYATSSKFMDRATHLLLVARNRRAAAPAARVVVST